MQRFRQPSSYAAISGYAPSLLSTPQTADEVIPVFSMDIYRYARVFSGTYKWVINGTLDVEKLRTGLDTLAHRGTWRKLGARIRQNAQGNLEWHVPRQYTPERPAYNLTVTTYSSMAAANLFIPTPTKDAPSIQPNMGPDSIFIHPNTPIKLEEYLDPTRDHPCFNLHVSLFLDGSATCIGITLPHIYGDGTGVSRMIANWLSLMRNPDASIPALHGYDMDPLAPLEGSFEFAEDLTMEKWDEILRNIRAQEVAEDHPREYRTVYLPGSHIQRMRAEAMRELRQRRSRGEDIPEFLSENDVLMAWWIKVMFADADPNDKTPLISIVGSSLRGRLTEYFPENTCYPHNATLAFASESIPISAVRDMSLCHIASLTRMALLKGMADKEALKRSVALKLWSKTLTVNNASSTSSPSSGFGKWHFTTCWTDAKCLHWDFSPAAAASQNNNNIAKPGGVRAFSGGVHLDGPYPVRALLTVLAKDKEGGYWLQPFLRKTDWNGELEERMGRYSRPRPYNAKL